MQAVGNDVPSAVGGKAPHEGKQQQPDGLKILDTKQPLASEVVRGDSQGKKKKKQAGNKKKGGDSNRGADVDKSHKEKENTDHNNKNKERKDGAEKTSNEGERHHHEPELPKKPA